MLLDRVLANAATEILPFAVCDVRRGVRIEMRPSDTPMLHCVARGNGVLWTTPDDATPLGEGALAIVPRAAASFVEPLGGSTRLVAIEAAGASDHMAKLVAGAGEPGLLLISARLCAHERSTLGSFDGLLGPVVVDLSDVHGVLSLLDTVLDEQQQRFAGNRRMIELLMQQCLLHALRKLSASADSTLPWLHALSDVGLARALNTILRSPAAAHSLRSLALAAGMSRPVFAARFAQAFGCAPLELVDRTRMREALRLLRTTDLSVADVTQRVGIPNRSELARELVAAATLAPRWLRPTPAPTPSAEAARAKVERTRPPTRQKTRASETTVVGRRAVTREAR